MFGDSSSVSAAAGVGDDSAEITVFDGSLSRVSYSSYIGDSAYLSCNSQVRDFSVRAEAVHKSPVAGKAVYGISVAVQYSIEAGGSVIVVILAEALPCLIA